jgi:single-stranded-DNA-specific exonuclease
MPANPLLTRWTLPSCDAAAAAALAHEAQVPEIVAALLIGRGIATAEAAKKYFAPALDQLHDPYLMLGMREAVGRIQQAVIANEPILIYGDYDVDGTTATVLLKTAIERLGASKDAKPDVRYHVPHRIREGYGMQAGILAEAYESGVRLVISVDTGVRAFAAAAEAKKLKLDLIVTDHHLPDEDRGVPEALAVLNPNQDGCTYPEKDLCGAGVAFKLAQALLEAAAADDVERERLRVKILPSFLKLLAIATIADSVPLRGENRVITAIGLRELKNPLQPGLRELMRLAQLDPAAPQPFTTTEIGFRLAPRINAAGRMDVASDVVELFLTRDVARAIELAEKLNALNEARRATELEALTAIEDLLATDAALPAPLLAHAAAIVLDGAEWHRGVIGILASRVVDRMFRPALVITHNAHGEEQGSGNRDQESENGIAHGSGRSVPGFHLLDALTAVDLAEGPPLFTRFGGHAHAVGFSLPSGMVPELRRRMEAYAAERATPETLAKEIACHAELPLEQITPALFAWLTKFEPLGIGNPAPVFVARGVRVAGPLKRLKEKHLKLKLQQGAARYDCLAWNWTERAEALGVGEGSIVDVAYRLRENTHPEFGGLELELADLKCCAHGE